MDDRSGNSKQEGENTIIHLLSENEFGALMVETLRALKKMLRRQSTIPYSLWDFMENVMEKVPNNL